MCGIVGMVMKNGNGLFQRTETTFFQMLYADALRGEDSTGIIGVEKDSTFHIAKSANTAEYFAWQYRMEHKNIQNAVYNRGKAYIGHNRKRTQGEVIDENAHPFVVENDFAMVHNGTLINHNQLAPDCAVDSEALTIHLRKAFRAGGDSLTKIKTELEDSLGQVNGAYAVACYDQTTHRVYLLRNKERPLSLFECDDAWYFMSEPLMGAWILQRNNYEYSKLKALPIAEHELIMFDMENPSTLKMYREQLSPKKYQTPSSITGQSWGGWPHGSTTGSGGGKSSKETIPKMTAIAGKRKGNPLLEDKELKKFRKGWLGKRVSFWTDDYLEANIGRTVDGDGESKVTLMGEHEDIGWWHTILADVDLHSLGIHYSEDITKNKWSGVISAISTTRQGCVQVYVENAKPYLESKTILELSSKTGSEVEKSRKFREELSHMTTEELDVLYEEYKHVWATWQISAANGERAFRAGIRTVEHAAEVCKRMENGFVLSQTEKHGHLLYVGETGKIYYESAITLH